MYLIKLRVLIVTVAFAIGGFMIGVSNYTSLTLKGVASFGYQEPQNDEEPKPTKPSFPANPGTFTSQNA